VYKTSPTLVNTHHTTMTYTPMRHDNMYNVQNCTLIRYLYIPFGCTHLLVWYISLCMAEKSMLIRYIYIPFGCTHLLLWYISLCMAEKSMLIRYIYIPFGCTHLLLWYISLCMAVLHGSIAWHRVVHKKYTTEGIINFVPRSLIFVPRLTNLCMCC